MRSAKAAAIAALALAGVSGWTQPAQAQWAVVCGNCSTLWDGMQQTLLEIEAKAARYKAYVLQGQQYANMVQNTVSMPRYMWMSLQQDIRTVQGILGGGDHYALNSGFSIGTLGSYAGYLGQVTDMPTKYRFWSAQATSNASSILRGLGLQQDQLAGDQALLAAQQNMVQLSSGQVQAIQSHAMLTGTLIGETQKLRQIELARAQMEVNQQAQQLDKENVANAQITRFLQPLPPAMTGNKRY